MITNPYAPRRIKQSWLCRQLTPRFVRAKDCIIRYRERVTDVTPLAAVRRQMSSAESLSILDTYQLTARLCLETKIGRLFVTRELTRRLIRSDTNRLHRNRRTSRPVHANSGTRPPGPNDREKGEEETERRGVER